MMSVLTELNKYVTSVGKNTFSYFEKGGEASLPASNPNDEHAWRWGYRTANTVTSYPFPGQNRYYYPGCILLADNKFHSENPTSISFKSDERKPLDITTTLYSSNVSSVQKFDVVNAGSILDSIHKNIVMPKLKDTLKASIPEYVQPKIEYFKESSGFELGGSISAKGLGIELGASEKRSKQVLLLTFRQEMFRVGLNDTYTAASDLFTEKLNLEALKKACIGTNGRSMPLSVINDVVYGRTVYLAISTTDYSLDLGASITYQSFKASAKIDKKLQKCSFYAKIVGGKPGTFNNFDGGISFDNANELIKRAMRSFDSEDISSAAPIEFSACFLDNIKVRQQLSTKIHERYAEMVKGVRLNIVRQTDGTLMNIKLRNLYPIPDKNGKLSWTLNFQDMKNVNDKTLGIISPHACYFEFKIDKHGDVKDSYDYNVFIPEIPLDKLERDSDGYYVFTFYVKGMLGNKQHAVSPYTRTIRYLRNNVVMYYGDKSCYFNYPERFKYATKQELRKEFEAWLAKKLNEKGWSSFVISN
jgi:hypothetical protein